ncbi:unnamed protein product [Zymoseptoria tritici ST99CH_1A5]|uniref:Apple domain-containing protein n=1 Tax=Zymoseptoria tritici ST99CH_1A5 TaxID=1276529 RepID=A0A1Y6LRE9_ZYMTR|nr:unnamed protein product [Zymoseptoria tritici ST99CH_1A5]
MKSLVHVAAALTAIVVPTLAATTTSDADIIFTTQAASQDPDSGSLCPDSNGKNITDNAGVRYAVSCNWIMTASGEEEVGGATSPLICMDACDDNVECYGVNMHLEGGCTLISGEQTGLRAAEGSLNLVRLGPAPVKSTSSKVQITSTAAAQSTSSKVQITKTVYVTASPSKAETSTTESSVQPAPSATQSFQCDLDSTNLCPQCDDTVAVDQAGIAYTIFCDSRLYSDSKYSIQEWLTPAGCLEYCDELDFCEGASYYDERSCELARGQNVFPIGQAGYTAFLPVYTGAPIALPDPASPSAFPTSAPRPTRFQLSNTTNVTTTSSSAEPTFSILPIDTGCNMSALTCPECTGAPYTDELNATYTVMCDFAPVCESLSYVDASSSQEDCMQDCDQDATCLAVLFFSTTQSCTLCKQGIEGGPGEDLDYIVLLADIDGDEDPETPATTPKPATTRPATTRPASAGWSGYPTNATRGPPSYNNTVTLPTATPAFTSTRRSITDLPTPFPVPSGIAVGPVGPVIPPASITANSTSATSTSDAATITSAASVSALPISAASCPGLAEGVFVDPTDYEFYKVLCDSILTAAHSRYTSASDFPACVAACTGDCDAVQFGYTTRCGLYTDVSLFGPGEGWTAAIRLVDATSTDLPYSTAVEATTTASLMPVMSASSNETITRAAASPVMTPAGLVGYKV